MLSPFIWALMAPVMEGVGELRSDRRLAWIVTIGVLVAALGLAGCGRKGALDPPPGAVAASSPPIEAQPSTGPQLGPDGQPLPPPPPRRSTIIDFLID
jgi:predicted small lipoprotein YifL